jgi:hypothetical protein
MSSHLINPRFLKLHLINNNNQTTINLLSVLRGFCNCLNWRWNLLDNTSICYCAPLLQYSPSCYGACLPVTVLPCLLMFSAACSDRRQKINEQPERMNMSSYPHHYLWSAKCRTCLIVLQYSALSCNYVTEGSMCLCSYGKVVD